MYDTFNITRPHFDALARVGYFKVVLKPETRWQKILHFYYRSIVWILVIMYNLQHIVHAIKVRHDNEQLFGTLFLLLTTLNALGKHLIFNIRVKRIDKIIETINSPLFASKNIYHEHFIKVHAKFMYRILIFYLTFGTSCSIFYSVCPYIVKSLGYEVIFNAYFPFDTSVSPAFELAVLHLGILITIQAYGHITMDCTIVSFYACARNQLQLLRYNLEHLLDELKPMLYINYIDDVVHAKEKLHKRVVVSVKHYNKIVWFTQEVESIFNEAMVLQFCVAAWVICTTAYRIVGLDMFSPEFFSTTMYLCCILGQLFMYCYFGTHLKVESELVNESIYRCEWLSLSPKFRRSLFIFMERCKRAIQPHTAFIIPMSLDTYISILRLSYTLYTIIDRKK